MMGGAEGGHRWAAAGVLAAVALVAAWVLHARSVAHGRVESTQELALEPFGREAVAAPAPAAERALGVPEPAALRPEGEPAGMPEPGAPLPPFDYEAARRALRQAAEQARECRAVGAAAGLGQVELSYEPSGRVSTVVILTERFAGTATGSCVQMLFRRARVPAFQGQAAVVLSESFEIPASSGPKP
jgi:hypothetical protein